MNRVRPGPARRRPAQRLLGGLALVLWLAACAPATPGPMAGPGTETATPKGVTPAEARNATTTRHETRPGAFPSSPAAAAAVLAATAPVPRTGTLATPAPAGSTPAGSTPTGPRPPALSEVSPAAAPVEPAYRLIGFSAAGHALEAFQLGRGGRHLLLVGGLHGGYEWNTISLAYQVIDYFTAYPGELPAGVTLTVIPSANPDGQLLATGRRGRLDNVIVAGDTFAGRFNANGVDLNRNWGCGWETSAWWRDQPVNPGPAPFSEPETRALRDFSLDIRASLVIFWHSAAGGVFLGSCDGQVLDDTARLGEAYAAAAGYPLAVGFAAYPISGDAADYLTTVGIPAFAVELTDHHGTELGPNLAGLRAVLAFFR